MPVCMSAISDQPYPRGFAPRTPQQRRSLAASPLAPLRWLARHARSRRDAEALKKPVNADRPEPVRAGMPIASLIQDLRYTFRTLRRDAGFAMFAIAIAGLGIGASSTVFSVVNTLLLRPLPFEA